jgi:putative ABC transport system substrate-binding protein
VAIAWPAGSRAQPAVLVIGFLGPGSPNTAPASLAKFLEGLAEAGYVEGQNVKIEYRWAEGHNDRLLALATDLVGHKVDVIFTGSMPAIRAAMRATSSIPIVVVMGVDPVATGVVTDLARPEGNLTGFTVYGPRLNVKRFEILSELVPQARIMGYITNPTNPASPKIVEQIGGNTYEVARAKGVELHLLKAGNPGEIDAAFEALAQLKAEGVLFAVDPLFQNRQDQILALTAQRRIPAIYDTRRFAEAGGLMSYGAKDGEAARSAGIYVGRVLAGAKPADLPVQMPTRFELVINRKAANTLGLSVPLVLETQADEIIE